MIIKLLGSSGLGATMVVITELLRRKQKINNEIARKVIHMAHGLVVAAWAFITGYSFIIAAEILFLIVVLLARRLKVMQPLRSVNRQSLGEIFFPIGVMAIALLNPTKAIFFVAMLHLAVADALAALVGSKFKAGAYRIFGYRKTIAGTLTFFVCSFFIMSGFVLVQADSLNFTIYDYLYFLTVVPAATTLIENLSVYGVDNLTLPILLSLLLKLV